MKDANGLKPHGRLQRLLAVTTTAVTSSWSSVRRSPPCAAVILLQMTKDGIICCPSFHSAERSMVKEPTFIHKEKRETTHTHWKMVGQQARFSLLNGDGPSGQKEFIYVLWYLIRP